MRKAAAKTARWILIAVASWFWYSSLWAQSSGPINTPQLNKSYFFVGQSPYTTTIQSAVTAACAATSHKGTVVVPLGVTPGDTPTGATGCTGVKIQVDLTAGNQCYSWGASGPYVAISCGTGGGGAALPTATAPGQIISSTAAGTTYAVQTNIFYSQPGDTIASIETECSSTCAYIVSNPQTITLAADHTLSANVWVSFLADGLWTVNGAHTFTFSNTPTSDFATQHFAGTATLNGFSGSARPEWWGVIAYSSVAAAGAGPNDVAKAQLVFSALTGGGLMHLQCAYYHIGGLVITANSQGIFGDCPWGVDSTGLSVADRVSTIVDTSASETILDAHGASSSVLLGNLTLTSFAVQRTILPTGTARGISLDHLVTANIDRVSSADSIDLLYMHNAGNVSVVNRFFGTWGFSSVSGASYTTGTPHGINLDSSDGVGEDTLAINNSFVGCGELSSVVATAMFNNGTNVSDVQTMNFIAGSCPLGQDTENAGTSGLVGQDVQYINSILNVCSVACMKINGVQSTLDVGPHVYVQGGNFFPVGTASFGITAHNSTNIGIAGVQILSGGLGVTDIFLSGLNGFTVTGNSIDDIDSGASDGISCLNSTHGTIGNNQIKKYSSGTGIKNVGCPLVSELGNSIAAPAGGTLGTGMSFDSGTSNSGPWSLNTIDSALVTTPVSDAGTNNNTLKPSILVINGGTPITSQSSTNSQVVTCPTGGSSIQYCGADGTWHTIPAAGVTSFTGDGAFASNSGSTGAVTLALVNAAAHKFWGNNTATTGPPGYFSIGTNDFSPNVYVAGAGSVNVMTATLVPAATALTAGLQAHVLPNLANTTTTPTLNVNALGAKTITKCGTGALVAGDYSTTSIADFEYDGTEWQLQNPLNACGASAGAVASVTANDGTVTISPTTGAVLVQVNLANPFIWTAKHTFNVAGAASTPGFSETGTVFTGGSGTTTLPYHYINQGASGPTTWSTSGTEFGINAVSGYGGNFLDFHVNGAGSIFTVGANGAVTARQWTNNGGGVMLTSTGTLQGPLIITGTKFTTSGCSVTSTTGGAAAGVFTLGANSCTVVITIDGATGLTAPNGWTCQAHDRTAPTVLIGGESSSTVTTASITIPAGAGTTDVISFSCIGY